MAKRITPREPDALATREVDHLVSRLLSEIKVPFGSLGTRVLNQLADLKRILSTDYLEVPALPAGTSLRAPHPSRLPHTPVLDNASTHRR